MRAERLLLFCGHQQLSIYSSVCHRIDSRNFLEGENEMLHCTYCLWRREWHPTPLFLPGESHGQRSLWAMVHGVTKNGTRLKKLNMHAR